MSAITAQQVRAAAKGRVNKSNLASVFVALGIGAVSKMRRLVHDSALRDRSGSDGVEQCHVGSRLFRHRFAREISFASNLARHRTGMQSRKREFRVFRFELRC